MRLLLILVNNDNCYSDCSGTQTSHIIVSIEKPEFASILLTTRYIMPTSFRSREFLPLYAVIFLGFLGYALTITLYIPCIPPEKNFDP